MLLNVDCLPVDSRYWLSLTIRASSHNIYVQHNFVSACIHLEQNRQNIKTIGVAVSDAFTSELCETDVSCWLYEVLILS